MPEANEPSSDSVIPRSVVDSVRETFKVQASTPVEILKVSTIDASASSTADIIAAIGMKSSTMWGTLAIFFEASTFLGIFNKMLGENATSITSDNADAAGEFLNIIYASARVRINQSGHDFDPAIPTVTQGTRVRLSHSGAPHIVRMDCRCAYGDFQLELSLRRS